MRHAAGGDPSILHRGKSRIRPVLDEEHERQQAAILGGDVLREGAVVAADIGQRAHQPVVRRVAHRVAALGVHRDARDAEQAERFGFRELGAQPAERVRAVRHDHLGERDGALWQIAPPAAAVR